MKKAGAEPSPIDKDETKTEAKPKEEVKTTLTPVARSLPPPQSGGDLWFPPQSGGDLWFPPQSDGLVTDLKVLKVMDLPTKQKEEETEMVKPQVKGTKKKNSRASRRVRNYQPKY